MTRLARRQFTRRVRLLKKRGVVYRFGRFCMTDKPLPVTYGDWCLARGVDHAHCPHDCEHPQPFVHESGRLVCGRCACYGRVLVDMVACVPGGPCEDG